MPFSEVVKNIIKYLFLGMVQGLTEVLPVSSSGHVVISQEFFGIADEGLLFLTLINLGSFIAILFHFRELIFGIIKDFIIYIFRPKTREKTQQGFEYALKIAIATIPAGIAGLLLASRIDDFYQDIRLIVVGVGLLLTATFLFAVRFAPNRHVNQEIRYKDAIVIGLIQAVGILPGFSRSGLTTSTGLARKRSMDTALKFSFMLYLPLSLGSSLQYVIKWINDPSDIASIEPGMIAYKIVFYIVAFIASLITTRFALKHVFRLFRRGKLVYFAFYTAFVGMIALFVGVMRY